MTTSDNRTEVSFTLSPTNVIWDEHYDNPKAEIILISNDMIGFRVKAWQLKKQSAFFSGLLEVPSAQSLQFAPIELDHGSETVRLFVDLIVTRNLSTQNIPTGMMLELFSICDKFQMEEMDNALMEDIRSRLMSPEDSVHLDPWSIFKFAANRGDIDMARACIQAFDDTEISHRSIYRAPPSHFIGIPGNFVTALLLAGYEYNDHDTEDDRRMWERSWYDVAMAFNLL